MDTDKFDYFMEPRWDTLVKAITHPAGGNSVSVAEEIALSYQVIVRYQSSLVCCSPVVV